MTIITENTMKRRIMFAENKTRKNQLNEVCKQIDGIEWNRDLDDNLDATIELSALKKLKKSQLASWRQFRTKNDLSNLVKTKEMPSGNLDNEETQFLAALRRPGASKPLQEMVEGLFQLKSYPLDYALGLTIGAGLIRCECGLWGDVDDLTENNIPIPCPHQNSQAEGMLTPSCPEPGPKYETCPKCKKVAIHLAMGYVHDFYGDEDDGRGDPGEYTDLEPPPGVHPYDFSEICLFAHFCFECGYMEDVGIEFPRDKAVDTSTGTNPLAQFSIVELLDELKIRGVK